jgi:hypothetical protein
VYDIGLVDMDYESSITVVTDTGITTIQIEKLGNNSVRTVAIDSANVLQLNLTLARSGAVKFLSLCSQSKETTSDTVVTENSHSQSNST